VIFFFFVRCYFIFFLFYVRAQGYVDYGNDKIKELKDLIRKFLIYVGVYIFSIVECLKNVLRFSLFSLFIRRVVGQGLGWALV
jgi:hypothetical protein